MKKNVTVCFMALITAVCMCAGCGNSSENTTASQTDNNSLDSSMSETSENNTDNSEVSSTEEDFSSQFVGRWEKGYQTNSNDEDAETALVKIEERSGYAKYAEFYSNGTGKTDYFVGYKDDTDVLFEWAVEYDTFYDAYVLNIYYAVDDPPSGKKVDENGYFVSKTSKSQGAEVISVIIEDSNENAEAYYFFDNSPYIKVSGSDFSDNPDLGHQEVFDSIKEYRTDPEAYKSQVEED